MMFQLLLKPLLTLSLRHPELLARTRPPTPPLKNTLKMGALRSKQMVNPHHKTKTLVSNSISNTTTICTSEHVEFTDHRRWSKSNFLYHLLTFKDSFFAPHLSKQFSNYHNPPPPKCANSNQCMGLLMCDSWSHSIATHHK